MTELLSDDTEHFLEDTCASLVQGAHSQAQGPKLVAEISGACDKETGSKTPLLTMA
jgi:hypothetical protein